MRVALSSALHFPPATAEQEDVATFVALGFCASSIYGCPEAAQHGRVIQTTASSTAEADAVCFPNEGFEIAVYR